MIALHKNQPGTPPFCLLNRHPCPNAIGSRLVGGGCDDTTGKGTANGRGFPPERRVIPLLHGGVKRVHIDVNNFPDFHGSGTWKQDSAADSHQPAAKPSYHSHHSRPRVIHAITRVPPQARGSPSFRFPKAEGRPQPEPREWSEDRRGPPPGSHGLPSPG